MVERTGKDKKKREDKRFDKKYEKANKVKADSSDEEAATAASQTSSSSKVLHSPKSPIADTGASSHMTPLPEVYFQNYQSRDSIVNTAGDQKLLGKGIGNLLFQPIDPTTREQITIVEFKKVLSVPGFE